MMSMTSSPATQAVSRRETPTRSRAARRGLVRYGYWWWTLPALVLTGTVIYAATAAGAFYSFTNWTGIGSYNFVGLSNFATVFKTPQFFKALVNTVLLAAGYVVFTNVLGLGFALALNRTLRTRHLLRMLIFMPVVLSPVAVAFIWKFIFAYNGSLNQVLGAVGLESLRHDWLAVPKLALGCVLVVMVWQSIGFTAVVYLAGLATVPGELEEAAAIDGAGMWQRFRRITLPLIQPSLAIAATLTLIQGLRVFDQVMALTGGGPDNATQTLATEIYQQTFTFQEFGFGAAMALILTMFILVCAVGQLALTRDRT